MVGAESCCTPADARAACVEVLGLPGGRLNTGEEPGEIKTQSAPEEVVGALH